MKYLILLLLALQLTNCTVQKRLYNSGYHVEWNNSFKKKRSDRHNRVEQEAVVLKEESVLDEPIVQRETSEQCVASTTLEFKATAEMKESERTPSESKACRILLKSPVAKAVPVVVKNRKATETNFQQSSASVQDDNRITQSSVLNWVLGCLIGLLGFCCGLVFAAPDLLIGILSSNSELPILEAFKEKRTDDTHSFLTAFARGACIGIYTMTVLIVVTAVAIFLANLYAQAGAAGILTILLVALLIFLFVWWLASLVGDWFYDMGHR